MELRYACQNVYFRTYESIGGSLCFKAAGIPCSIFMDPRIVKNHKQKC